MYLYMKTHLYAIRMVETSPNRFCSASTDLRNFPPHISTTLLSRHGVPYCKAPVTSSVQHGVNSAVKSQLPSTSYIGSSSSGKSVLGDAAAFTVTVSVETDSDSARPCGALGRELDCSSSDPKLQFI